jgi:hypothetical protein
MAAQYPSLTDVRLNPAAVAPRGPLYSRFAAARAATEHTHTVQLMLHGSPEANVDSILASSLRGRPGCNSRWLTSCEITAKGYMRGASRIVVFAVLTPKAPHSSPPYVHISTDDAHQVPLFVARWRKKTDSAHGCCIS